MEFIFLKGGIFMKKLLTIGTFFIGVTLVGVFALTKTISFAENNAESIPVAKEEGKVRVCITDLPEAEQEKEYEKIRNAVNAMPSKVYNREEEPIVYDPNAPRMAEMTDDELYDKLIELGLYLESWSQYDHVKEFVVKKARYTLETGRHKGANFTENTELALRIRTIIIEYEGMGDSYDDDQYDNYSKFYEFRRPYTYSRAE